MILLYLEGSGSKFQSVNTKTSQFCQFFGVQELRKKHVNTKNSQFSTFFGFQELRKNMYIYICIYVNYFQPFPHILWVAQLPMGFHVAPGTPVDARNAMFSHQTFVLCSISAPDFCKTMDICIYIYACLFKPFSKETLFLGAPLNFQILPSILVYANGSKFLYFQMHLTYTHIYIYTHI